jgi:hypothetical protein
MKNGPWFMKNGPRCTGCIGCTGLATPTKMAVYMLYKPSPNPAHHSHLENRKRNTKLFAASCFTSATCATYAVPAVYKNRLWGGE